MKKLALGMLLALTTTAGAYAQTTVVTTSEPPAGVMTFTPEQTTVIRRTIVQPTTTVAVPADTIEVGATIPETVTLQPVPQTLVTAIPNASHYRYVALDNRVVFVDPETNRIVAVVNNQ